MKKSLFGPPSVLARGLPLLTAQDVILGLGDPIRSDVHNAALELIDVETQLIASDVEVQYSREREETAGKIESLEEKLTEMHSKKEEAKTKALQAEAKPGSLARSVLYWPSVVAVAVCEYYITWCTLPPALDIPQDSWLGYTISLAPVIAFLILKEPVERFLKTASETAVSAFTYSIGLLNLLLAVLLGVARNEVTRVMTALLRGAKDISFNENVMEAFIVALSLVLVLDGALFLALAMRYGTDWMNWMKARVRVWRLNRAEQALLEAKSELIAMRVGIEKMLQEGRGRIVADAYRRQCLVELAKRKLAVPTIKDEVEFRTGLAKESPYCGCASN